MTPEVLNWLQSIRLTERVEPVITVYTAMFGGLDVLARPAIQRIPMRFVCFTNEPVLTPGWETVPVGTLPLDPRRSARALKLHPHLLFPDSSISVWLDASIAVVGDIAELLTYVNEALPIALFRHPDRNDIYEEALACARLSKDSSEVMAPQVQRYQAEGLPSGAGLMMTGILVRVHNARKTQDFMDSWWTEIESGSVRDQLSFPYVAWTLGPSYRELPTRYRFPPYLELRRHKRQVVYDRDGGGRVPFQYWPIMSFITRVRRRLQREWSRLLSSRT